MARIITENKELIQSYIFTAAKYDFTAYEIRIMYRLVECGIKIFVRQQLVMVRVSTLFMVRQSSMQVWTFLLIREQMFMLPETEQW